MAVGATSCAISTFLYGTDVRSELARLYGEHRADRLLDRFADLVEGYRRARPERLRQRDEKLADDWFRDPHYAIYVLYADRFCPEASARSEAYGLTPFGPACPGRTETTAAWERE